MFNCVSFFTVFYQILLSFRCNTKVTHKYNILLVKCRSQNDIVIKGLQSSDAILVLSPCCSLQALQYLLKLKTARHYVLNFHGLITLLMVFISFFRVNKMKPILILLACYFTSTSALGKFFFLASQYLNE